MWVLNSDCEACGGSEFQTELAEYAAAEHIIPLPSLNTYGLEHHPDDCELCYLLHERWDEVVVG